MHDDEDFHGDDHGHLHTLASLEQNPDFITEDVEGFEVFTLRSVGIDIGSSTTHMIFSRLKLRREGAGFASTFKVAEREVLFQSPIMLTPYLSGSLIDTDKVKAFITKGYADAGVETGDVDTGAVVITGEALKKENAQPIVEFFAKESGKFICASAGAHHEALIAAHGSGAAGLSKEKGVPVLNVDMGGGTTKLSFIEKGEVKQTSAVSIGARLFAFDDQSIINRVEDPANMIMSRLGRSVEIGRTISEEEKVQYAGLMADALFDLILGREPSDLAQELMITEHLNAEDVKRAEYVVFSGGVSEYVYENDATAYGDVGPHLGAAVRERIGQYAGQLHHPVAGIRATVIGAGEYTLQASTTTSFLSNPEVLPQFGLQVIKWATESEQTLDEMKRNFSLSLDKHDLEQPSQETALAVSIAGYPDYPYMRKVAEAIAEKMNRPGADSAPLHLILDHDVAKSLGGILKNELNVQQEIVGVDGIDVGDLDFVDIGNAMGTSGVIPVTVKSLIFGLKSQY
jgi:ethanolamine utilization protein EutA